jgi:hypothetical protein
MAKPLAQRNTGYDHDGKMGTHARHLSRTNAPDEAQVGLYQHRIIESVDMETSGPKRGH